MSSEQILTGAVSLVGVLVGVIYAHLLSKIKDNGVDLEKREASLREYIKLMKPTGECLTIQSQFSSKMESMQREWQITFSAMQERIRTENKNLKDDMFEIKEIMKVNSACLQRLANGKKCDD
jgi:hypothetical protein